MLGPIAGGLIVGYLHWRVIFFVNIPIGLLGLVMVYLHLPDYRQAARPAARYRRPDPVRLRRGVAVLRAGDIRRAHAERGRDPGAAGDFAGADRRLRPARNAHQISAAAAGPVSHPHFQRRGQRQFLYPHRHRRRAVPAAAALPDRARAHADPVGPADHAAGAGRDEHQVPDAARY